MTLWEFTQAYCFGIGAALTIGTLVVIARALGYWISDLIQDQDARNRIGRLERLEQRRIDAQFDEIRHLPTARGH